MRRTLFALLAALALPWFGLSAAQAQTQDLPDRPIRVVVPFPPGGGSDIIIRTITQAAARYFPQPLVVDNKPGANGVPGTGEVARAPADGTVIGQCAFGTCGANPALYPMNYDVERDFAFIVFAGYSDLVFVTRKDLPQTSLAEILAEAKRRPGQFTFASSGVGSSNHMGMALLNLAAGTTMEHIPYRGGAQAINDVLAGRIDLYLDNISAVLPHIRAGNMRAIAVPAPTRNPLLPDVPTFAELGYPQMQIRSWAGFMAPARTPPATIAAMNAAFNKALAEPALRDQLAAIGVTAAGGTPEEFATHVHSEIQRWRKVVQEAGIRPE